MNRAITPQAIWIAGIALLVLDGSQRPYWQTVWKAISTGKAPKAGTDSTVKPYGGLFLTAGGVVLLALLASLAAGSDEGGELAGAFLVVLWAGWLITHPSAITTIAGLFNPNTGAAASQGGGSHRFL